MKILIKNGHVVDPANNINGVMDVLVQDGCIAKVAKTIAEKEAHNYDAAGKIVMPGLVDMHVHLREPGREDKETILTGTKAALKGGFTSILAMPNTTPAIDCVEHVQLLRRLIEKDAQVSVFVCAAITRQRAGQELVDITALKKEGVVAISDDGCSVDNDEIMTQAFKKAAQEHVAVICHSEDKGMAANGVINLGFVSTQLGLKGISRESEYERVKRDIDLAASMHAAVHIAHVSTRESVDIIAAAKQKGIRVTAETAPHYFALDEEAVLGYDTNMKMNPPLREAQDVAAIRQALKDGVIDAIASDHAPHTENEKEIEFDRAEFGVIGLETSLAVAVTELVEKGILNWAQLVERMSLNPAQILGIDKGTLGISKEADIVIFDPNKEWTVEKHSFVSLSKNSPFLGRVMKGVVERVILGGKLVYQIA
ncbi:MAG: dihydroorotase [Candidatus Omnitrophota bacterium]